MSATQTTTVTRISRITDLWLRPVAGLATPLALWVSLLHCQRTWRHCGEWGCADGVFHPSGCANVGSLWVEPWALAAVAAAFAVCVFGGVHRA